MREFKQLEGFKIEKNSRILNEKIGNDFGKKIDKFHEEFLYQLLTIYEQKRPLSYSRFMIANERNNHRYEAIIRKTNQNNSQQATNTPFEAEIKKEWDALKTFLFSKNFGTRKRIITKNSITTWARASREFLNLLLRNSYAYQKDKNQM